MYSLEEENEIFCVINKLRKLAIRNTTLPISHVEFMVLHTISKATNEKIKISDIASIMEVSTPAISKMLRNLEEKDFIVRINNDNDRRVTYVRITEQGKEVLYKSFQMFRKLMDSITARMGKEKIKELMSLFRELTFNMADELEKHPISINIDHLEDKKTTINHNI